MLPFSSKAVYLLDANEKIVQVMLRNIWEKDGSICLGFEVEGG
jgi:hypothetical protein